MIFAVKKEKQVQEEKQSVKMEGGMIWIDSKRRLLSGGDVWIEAR